MPAILEMGPRLAAYVEEESFLISRHGLDSPEATTNSLLGLGGHPKPASPGSGRDVDEGGRG